MFAARSGTNIVDRVDFFKYNNNGDERQSRKHHAFNHAQLSGLLLQTFACEESAHEISNVFCFLSLYS